MPFGVHAATVYFYAVLCIQLIITVFAPLRYYLLRAHKRSVLALWSELCFFVGWAFAMATGWTLFHHARVELEVRREMNNETEVIREMTRMFVLKVPAIPTSREGGRGAGGLMEVWEFRYSS